MTKQILNIFFEWKAGTLCIGLLFFSSIVFAQDTASLQSVKIREYLERSTQKMDSIDQLFYKNQALVDMLQLQSLAFVRSNGLNNLSTLSLRGSSSAQSNVEWNGISIQNAMMGLTDLSLLPSSFFDKISLELGDQKSNRSAQAVGGTLVLGSGGIGREILRQLDGGIQYESFKNARAQAHFVENTRRARLDLRALHGLGRNEYSFYNFHSSQEDSITHAQGSQTHLALDYQYNLKEKDKLSLHSWFTMNDREIPPTAFETSSAKLEKSRSFRNVLSWQHIENKWFSKLTLGRIDDHLDYRDSLYLIETEAKVMSVPLQADFNYFFSPKTSLGIFARYRYSSMDVNQLDREELNIGNVTLEIAQDDILKHLDLSLSATLNAAYNDESLPINYKAKLNYEALPGARIHLQYATNVRLPTLNELYYNPGGNPLLKPEKSRNMELGLTLDKKISSIRVKNQFAAYSRKVDDWIVWNGSSIFFPSNILEVWSRGLENDLKLDYKISQQRLRSQVLYTYTLATTEKTNLNNDNSIGKQIPYVPRYQFKLAQYFMHEKFSLGANYNYTSYRFFKRDESRFLFPYQLVDLHLSVPIKLQKKKVELQLHLNNILNAEWESVRGRIMPRRNFRISLNLK